MGNSQSTIKVLDIPLNTLQKNISIQKSNYIQPYRQFTTEYHKNNSNTFHQSVLNIKYSQKQIILSVSQTRYKQIQLAYEQKTKNFEINAIIFDQYYNDRVLYLVSDGKMNKTIAIRSFDKYESYIFNNITCQVKLNEEITNFVGNNLLKMTDSYIIESGPIKFDDLTNTQVIQFQPVEASLSEIIKYRRQNNWQWNQTEFNQLTYDLISAVNVLHSNNISHNDIRPQNIYYSSTKKCYVLGQFSYALKEIGRGNLRNNRASFHYAPPQINSKQQYDLKKADIYSLGITLLCALFLSNPLNLNQCKNYFFKFSSLKSFQLIMEMLKLDIQKKSIYQIYRLTYNPQYINSGMKNLIESLRYKTKPRNKNHSLYMHITSQFFKRLGLWDYWRDQVEQILQTDTNINKYKTAQLYKQLALIDFCQDQLDDSTMNAKLAAKIYRQLGQQAFKEGNLNLASKNFTSAIQCSKFYVNKYDLDLAKSLICLSNIHAQKRQEDFSRTLLAQAKDLVTKQSTQDSIVYCQMKIKQAQLNNKFFKYEQSLFDLNQTLPITRRLSALNQKQARITEAKIMTLIAENQISIAKLTQDQFQKAQILEKAQKHLNDSKNLYESLQQIQCHIELADNTEVLGQLFLIKEQFDLAKLCFQKSFQMKKWYQQNKEISDLTQSNANTLSNLGRCQRLMNKQHLPQIYQESLNHQLQALNIFKKIYGSDHNYYSACILKEIGILYNQMNNIPKARECFQCSRKIMQDLFGNNSPYDQIADHQVMFRKH